MDQFTLNQFIPIPIANDFDDFNIIDKDTDNENGIKYRY